MASPMSFAAWPWSRASISARRPCASSSKRRPLRPLPPSPCRNKIPRVPEPPRCDASPGISRNRPHGLSELCAKPRYHPRRRIKPVDRCRPLVWQQASAPTRRHTRHGCSRGLAAVHWPPHHLHFLFPLGLVPGPVCPPHRGLALRLL